MDVNGLFRMLTRMFLNKAINAGIDYAARRGKPKAEMTPEERKFMVDHGTGDLSNEFYTWLVDETVKTLRKYM